MKPASLFSAAVLLAALVAITTGFLPARAQEGIAIPAPDFDPTDAATEQTLILAGGCFWGVQGVFQHVTGVTRAVSGYAGGSSTNANYNAVVTGRTGHAEAVQITYDPRQISAGEILHIFFSVAHDPTQLNRQGPDRGPQYRSAIFPHSEEQAQLARAYIQQLNAERVFDAAIVTKIEPGHTFYPAEAWHQDYMTRHPTQPYIVINDLPKVANLQRLFADRFRSEPLLVAQTGV